MSDSLQPQGLQHARLPCPSLLQEFAQTYVHWVDDAIQPSHPLSLPSPPALNLSQLQGLFQRVSSLHQVAKYWSFSISPFNEYSGWISCCLRDGNPLQCSCLENPRDRGAWWAAVYGVTQSRTRLKWLSSSSSKGLSRVFSYITIRKHQFFGAQPSLWFNSHIRTWLLEKPQLWLDGPLSAKWCPQSNVLIISSHLGFPGGASGKEFAFAGDTRDTCLLFIPRSIWSRDFIPWGHWKA